MQLASDFGDLADQARDILTSPSITLSPDQSNVVAADMSQLNNIAANLATWSAAIIFADSDGAFQSISNATTAAKASLATIVKQIGEISSAIGILGKVVSLGVAFGTGDFVSVLTAATGLANLVSGS
jgi:hypothetical protein